MEQMKILVVDDEQDLCDILLFNLRTGGYVAEAVYSAEQAMEKNLASYDLLLLDVMMPDPNKTIRENSIYMRDRDYELKKQAYEKAYGKELTYDFDITDIAGWHPDLIELQNEEATKTAENNK